jgi:hypothetical protein
MGGLATPKIHGHPRLHILAGRPPIGVASQPVKGLVFWFLF